MIYNSSGNKIPMKGVMRVFITDNILVCVTQQKTCERLIKHGATLNSKVEADLYVIHVAKDGFNFLGNAKEAEALEYLFGISKQAGADLTVLRSENIADAIVEFANNKNIGHIILGANPVDSKEDSIISELKRKLSFCKFYIMPANELE